MLEFTVCGRAWGKSRIVSDALKNQFKCGCMTDALFDSLKSQGSSIVDFECKHGVSITFAKGGKV